MAMRILFSPPCKGEETLAGKGFKCRISSATPEALFEAIIYLTNQS